MDIERLKDEKRDYHKVRRKMARRHMVDDRGEDEVDQEDVDMEGEKHPDKHKDHVFGDEHKIVRSKAVDSHGDVSEDHERLMKRRPPKHERKALATVMLAKKMEKHHKAR